MDKLRVWWIPQMCAIKSLYMQKNKLPRTTETYEKVIKFICDRRKKHLKD